MRNRLAHGPTFLLAICLWLAAPAIAEDIEGVQPAALDQPRINLIMRRQAGGPVLMVAGQAGFNVEAFLDTGASGIMLSPHTAQQLGIARETVSAPGGKGGEARFEDVGVGGGDQFAVSEPLLLSLASYSPSTNTDDTDAIAGTYTLNVGPFRAQIGPLGGGGDLLTALAMADLDVAGMPVMRDKIVVLNVKPVNTFSDTIRTTIYDPATAPAGIATCKRHVKLGYASFARFTTTSPASAQPPSMAENPFIGPNPLAAANDRTPPMQAAHHGKTIAGSWLLDTGAAASMISRANAASLGVTYVEGTFGTDHPKLAGVPADQQFTLTVGGVGGSKKAAGFFLDELRLSTTEGQPLVFKRAPVLVSDITVQDRATGKSLTLDGVFGMNFLTASCMVDESALLPDMKNMTAGAFEKIVIDHRAGVLGLQ
jgi:hypothetical protein